MTATGGAGSAGEKTAHPAPLRITTESPWRKGADALAAALILALLVLFWLGLLPDGDGAGRWLFLLFVLAGLGGIYGSLRLLLQPVTLLTVTPDGLDIHTGRANGKRHHLPWQAVTGMEIISRDLPQRGAEEPTDEPANPGRVPAIVLSLAPAFAPEQLDAWPARLVERGPGGRLSVVVDLPASGIDAAKVLRQLASARQAAQPTRP